MSLQEDKVLFMYYTEKAKEFKDTDKEKFNFFMSKAQEVLDRIENKEKLKEK